MQRLQTDRQVDRHL